jgi:uncharacterized repeat protein (TIGR03803 family)
VLAIVTIAVPAAHAQTFTVLHTFTGQPDGANPRSSVIHDSASGSLYGTAAQGGLLTCGNGCGVVFQIDKKGQETVLYSFQPGGQNPPTGLVRDKAGNLYGVNDWTLFKVDSSGTETVLYVFCSQHNCLEESPTARLVQDGSGNLYGTTSGGGNTSCPAGCGVVFKLDSNLNYTVLYSFTGTSDGSNPTDGPLLLDKAGNLYGATQAGASGFGTVFKLDAKGNLTTLYIFTGGADGGYPRSLVRDRAGNFYGTTAGGGASGNGIVFKLTPQGKATVLHTFAAGKDGANPQAGLVRDGKGILYGTTYYGGGVGCGGYGCGTVFKVAPKTRKETMLHTFTGGNDGANPAAALLRDATGNLYGTAEQGGDASCGLPFAGCGVLFRITP